MILRYEHKNLSLRLFNNQPPQHTKHTTAKRSASHTTSGHSPYNARATLMSQKSQSRENLALATHTLWLTLTQKKASRRAIAR